MRKSVGTIVASLFVVFMAIYNRVGLQREAPKLGGAIFHFKL